MGVDWIPLAQDMVIREVTWNRNVVCRIQKSLSFRPYPEGVETTPQHYIQFLKLYFGSIIQHASFSQMEFCCYVFRVKFCICFSFRCEDGGRIGKAFGSLYGFR
jgi:hypothetical protein